MLFNSYEFLILVSVTFALYYAFKRFQVFTLLIASLLFYAFSSPKLLILLICSAGINVLARYYIEQKPSNSKLIATLGVIVNLGILIFFKYSPLLGTTFFDTSSIGAWLINIPLPIGISFFTFQGISLIIDTYKNQSAPDGVEPSKQAFHKHVLDTSMFIVFFPQLVAGPIVKSKDFLPQIVTKYLSDIQWNTTFRNIVTGFFLKMVIADNLKDFTLNMDYPYYQGKPTLDLLAMLFGYSMQIFADFAGYSLIAIGVAGLFSYTLKENFDFPYISKSFSEFWRRWHISLSSFLKEYLYFSLGGNRRSKLRTYINLFITMALGGLWHGAAWSYMIWGMYHGLALAIERYFKDSFGSIRKWYWIWLKSILVFSIVTFGWLLFRLPDFQDVIGYTRAIIENSSQAITLKDLRSIGLIAIYSMPIVCYHLYYLYKQRYGREGFDKLEYIVLGLMMFMILTNSGSSSAFIYFQF